MFDADWVMTRYLISFDDGAMTFPEEELPDVSKSAQAVVQEARPRAYGFSPLGWNIRCRASWPPTALSPTGPTRSPRSTSADSRSSTWPHGRRRWSGLPRSPRPAGVRKRSSSSCLTRPTKQAPRIAAVALRRDQRSQAPSRVHVPHLGRHPLPGRDGRRLPDRPHGRQAHLQLTSGILLRRVNRADKSSRTVRQQPIGVTQWHRSTAVRDGQRPPPGTGGLRGFETGAARPAQPAVDQMS